MLMEDILHHPDSLKSPKLQWLRDPKAQDFLHQQYVKKNATCWQRAARLNWDGLP